jgi:hypothetical protein
MIRSKIGLEWIVEQVMLSESDAFDQPGFIE